MGSDVTKTAALQAWFGQFMTAYPSTAVPDDVIYPYLTYEAQTSAYNGDASSEAYIAVQLYFYTESEAVPNAAAEQISKAIGAGGILLHCDDGHIWVMRGSPWCIPFNDTVSPSVKGRRLNVTLRFLTD